jgi:hypothetical protein
MRCQLMFGPSAISPRRSDGIAVRRSARGAAGFGSTRLSLRQCASRGQQSAAVTSISDRVVAARTHRLIAAGIVGDGRRVGGGAGLRGAGRGRTVTLPRRGDRVGLAVDSRGRGLRMGSSRKKQKCKADRHSHKSYPAIVACHFRDALRSKSGLCRLQFGEHLASLSLGWLRCATVVP